MPDEPAGRTDAASVLDDTLFQHLPSPLVLSIVQQLSLRAKLLHLTHISRSSFPALQPLAFAFDGIELTPPVLSAWRQSERLRDLLSHVGAVLLRETVERHSDNQSAPLLDALLPSALNHGADTAAGSAVPPPLPLPAPTLAAFHATRSLHLDDLGTDLPPDCLTRVADGMPRLESLRVHVRSPNPLLPPVAAVHAPSFLSPLTALHGLRTLVIAQSSSSAVQLEYSAFRILCSLPLTHLDIANTELLLPADFDRHEQPQPHGSANWHLLRLPRCSSELIGRSFEMLLQRPSAVVRSADDNGTAEAAHRLSGLRYLSIPIARWQPDSLIRCLTAVGSSLVSLELHAINQALFTPAMLLDTTGTATRPLLPHLQHLCIGRREYTLHRDMTAEEADSWTDSLVQLLHHYGQQLRRVALSAPIGSSCWPLLQATFLCSRLLRCELTLDIRLRGPAGAPIFDEVLAALRPDAEPPSLPPLPHLHTLQLDLPLTAGELQRVLQACPALLQLAIGQIHALDALQGTRLIAQHGSPTLRSLELRAMVPLTAAYNGETDAGTPGALLSRAPFPALRAFQVGRDFFPQWSEPALLQMVQLLRYAPLTHLKMMHAPLHLLHLLKPLTQLRSLRTAASIGNFYDPGGAMPSDYHAYFSRSSRCGAPGCRGAMHGGQLELRRRLVGDLIDDEVDDVSDEQLTAQAEVAYSPGSCHVFVRERRFHGLDGREAFMAALQGEVAVQMQWPPLTS